MSYVSSEHPLAMYIEHLFWRLGSHTHFIDSGLKFLNLEIYVHVILHGPGGQTMHPTKDPLGVV